MTEVMVAGRPEGAGIIPGSPLEPAVHESSFAGLTALVTGAASGIGRGTALAFARAGAQLVLVDIDAEAGAALAAQIEAGGGSALFVRTDVSDAQQVDAMMASALARFGRIDCAFNNAGIEEEHLKLAESDEALYDRMMAINVKGVWLCMRRQIAQMLVQGGGAIVNTASVAGIVGAPRHAIYAASKHAVVGLTKSAAVEYGKKGIRINSVCPGVIRTPMLERALARDPNWESSLVALHPIGRLGEVADVAAAVLYLCSDAAAFLCGHQLVVDGGMTIV